MRTPLFFSTIRPSVRRRHAWRAGRLRRLSYGRLLRSEPLESRHLLSSYGLTFKTLGFVAEGAFTGQEIEMHTAPGAT